MENRPKPDLRSELLKLLEWQTKDFFMNLRFALICVVIGAMLGAALCIYFDLPWLVGAKVGGACLGVIGLVSWMGPFRHR